jgi:CHAT domain-containing protein
LAASRREAPPEITVLFLAASPEDEDALRLDQETREIQQRVRASEHRDSISFAWKLARQLPDLLQDLNETRPHIVHFSGHGNQTELAFEDADGAAKPHSNELLAQLLAVNSDRIRLAVFNSCQSAAQAELACEHIDLAIGMSTSIEDDAAKTFAGQFYNSLGFGKSVAGAFEQAKLQVALVHGDGHDAPELFAAGEIDPATVVLVNPGETGSE